MTDIRTILMPFYNNIIDRLSGALSLASLFGAHLVRALGDLILKTALEHGCDVGLYLWTVESNCFMRIDSIYVKKFKATYYNGILRG